MTSTHEIEALAARMMQRGVWVALTFDGKAQRSVRTVRIANAPGIGSHPMAPIAAAERMREWLRWAEQRADKNQAVA